MSTRPGLSPLTIASVSNANCSPYSLNRFVAARKSAAGMAGWSSAPGGGGCGGHSGGWLRRAQEPASKSTEDQAEAQGLPEMDVRDGWGHHGVWEK